MAVLYVQTTQVPIFAYYPPSPIAGLSLTLPEGGRRGSDGHPERAEFLDE